MTRIRRWLAGLGGTDIMWACGWLMASIGAAAEFGWPIALIASGVCLSAFVIWAKLPPSGPGRRA